MNEIRSLILFVILMLSHLSPAAEASKPLTSQLGKSAFAIDVPAGWKAQSLGPDLTIRGGAALFELLREDPSDQATSRIWVTYFKVSIPALASVQWEKGGRPETVARRGELPLRSELSNSGDLASWYITEATNTQFNAYTNLGDDVVVFGLLAQGSGPYEEGKRAVLSVIKSYREVEAHN